MGTNTSVSLGGHFEEFIGHSVKSGRFASASDVIRAGLRLLEQEETKLERLKKELAIGEAELDQGLGLDGESVMQELIGG